MKSSGRKAAKGDVSIDYATFPAPSEEDLKTVLFEVIEQLASPGHEFGSRDELSQVDTDVEFIRDESTKKNRIHSDSVIMYMHGGGL